MIINRIYETQNLVAVASFLPGRAKDLSAPLYTLLSKNIYTVFQTFKFFKPAFDIPFTISQFRHV